MSAFRMNSPEGKAILALIREGDYAHPGEEEAIVLAADRIDRTGIRRILDVGCGRGGTAAWFQRQGWGAVTGVDLDLQSIEYARRRYPKVSFFRSDVVRLDLLGLAPFDLLYLLTSLYAFSDQPLALRQMRRVCRDGGQLLIVDYARYRDRSLPLELGAEIGRPIVLDAIEGDLTAAGWTLTTMDDWSQQFLGWYESLLGRIRQRRPDIVRLAGQEWYEYVASWYGALRGALAEGRIAGTALTAVAGYAKAGET